MWAAPKQRYFNKIVEWFRHAYESGLMERKNRLKLCKYKVSQTWIKWYLLLVVSVAIAMQRILRHLSLCSRLIKFCRLKFNGNCFIAWKCAVCMLRLRLVSLLVCDVVGGVSAVGVCLCDHNANCFSFPHKSIHTKIKSHLIYWSLLLFRHL